jgi:predicted transcriptional regulator
MKQTPCEYIVWHGLPVLRKEIVKSMIENFGLSQKEAAERLGITSSAVSQYLSGKRANPDITDKAVLYEIDKSAERIIKKGNGVIISETCRLCKFFSSKKIFPFICEYCAEER